MLINWLYKSCDQNDHLNTRLLKGSMMVPLFKGRYSDRKCILKSAGLSNAQAVISGPKLKLLIAVGSTCSKKNLSESIKR